MKRIWFIFVPVALFIWALIDGNIKQAVGVGLISFIFGAGALLLALRMNWRWGNSIAAVVAFAGLILSAGAYSQIRAIAKTPQAVEVAPCPPEGCRMIAIEPSAEPEEYP